MALAGREVIEEGKAALGIEFGSTRIKGVLVDEDNNVLAIGTYDWENRLENGVWTYSLEDIWKGLQGCYASVIADVQAKYGVPVRRLAALGFSGMMHGYLAFNAQGELLVPFRTWRNTITGEAAEKLTELFHFNIPQRWSIAHLYQAILNGEEHVKDVDFFTTLAGYIHWKMTGCRVLGVGEASGMFPIDPDTRDFDQTMIAAFDRLLDGKYSWKLQEILPKVMVAGQNAGTLTEEGAKLLDVSGQLEAGVPLCPPEGDAGTGMVATNSVAVSTGNVSAGTSVFAMVVMEKNLENVYTELDMVTTPGGEPVAMVHCNNCTSDLNAWVNLFKEFWAAMGMEPDMNQIFSVLYNRALTGDADCGGLLAYNYFAGETITGFDEGRPLFVRMPDAKLSLANFMRSHLFSSLATLKIGLDILLKKEKVKVTSMMGHGGLFKTEGVGQSILAAAVDAPVTVMKTAGEGGAWGIAVLANYMVNKEKDESLAAYLDNKVFAGEEGTTLAPKAEDVAGFEAFMKRYMKGLPIERAAVEHMQG